MMELRRRRVATIPASASLRIKPPDFHKRSELSYPLASPPPSVLVGKTFAAAWQAICPIGLNNPRLLTSVLGKTKWLVRKRERHSRDWPPVLAGVLPAEGKQEL
ncbi:hypothetical protein KQX54_008622, partial [Cotesia glomerata]